MKINEGDKDIPFCKKGVFLRLEDVTSKTFLISSPQTPILLFNDKIIFDLFAQVNNIHGCFFGTAFIDLKKAFDTLDHAILCHKLELYGLYLSQLMWFKSNPFYQKQYCRVRGFHFDISNSVSQGSCFRVTFIFTLH